MPEVARILDQLHRAYEGPAWHGPALREILAGLTFETAAQRTIPDAHTIWELVLHITVWMSVPTPVSYTHLDVYKRQGCIAWSSIRCNRDPPSALGSSCC